MSEPPTKVVGKPSWLIDYEERISILRVIAKAFEIDCNCDVCTIIRTNAEKWGQMFGTQTPGG